MVKNDPVFIGIVKCYDPKEGVGIIHPIERGGAEVTFNAVFYSGISRVGGKVRMPAAQAKGARKPNYHHPEKGERVVYSEYIFKGKPIAIAWAYAETWDAVHAVPA